MIRLDERVGSKELERLFTPYGIVPLLTRLEFGDLDFIGHGPKGDTAVVIERKRIDDLIQSMQSHRLSGHQLPGMARQYDYCYLVVEGIWRRGKEGNVEVLTNGWVSRGLSYRAITSYLSTLQLRAGVNVWQTTNEYDTVGWVVDTYRWWTQKKWDEHNAHEAVYAPADTNQGQGRKLSFKPREVRLAEKIALQLPGIADKRASEKKLQGFIEKLLGVGKDRWEKEGGVGKSTAQKIQGALNGR